MKSLVLKRIGNFCFSLALLGMLISCGSDKKQEKYSSEYEDAASELSDKVEEFLYEIPTPAEIPFIIEATGADFNPDIVNDIKKAEKYASNNKIAALNLGIYATDIGYLVTYEQVQEALIYMDGALNIGEALGLQSTIDISIIEKFESNLAKKDSLAMIINEVISNSDDYLKENERNNMAALIISGTFIEGLYISTQIINSYPLDILPDDSRNLILTPLIRIIIEQEKPLADMIGLLKSIEDKGDWIEGLINSLEELKNNYEALDIQEQISNNRADLILSDQVLYKITKQIEKIRATVTY